MDEYTLQRHNPAMFEVTRAIILAAGVGSRLKSYTAHQPKALMPIAGQAAIVHVIRQLSKQGIQDIAINVHHCAQQIQAYLGDGSAWNARLYYSYEPTLLDSGGGVRQALDFLPGDGLVAVYNADILSRINLKALAARCPDDGCALALVPNPKHHTTGDFSLLDQYIIPRTQTSYTFAGVSIWQANLFADYASGSCFPLTKPIQQAMQQQHCTGLLYHDYWFDIGRPRDLIQANRFFQQTHAVDSF